MTPPSGRDGSALKRAPRAADPRGLIRESFNIEGISEKDCRTIFLDWALGAPGESDIGALISALAAHYSPLHPGHPMVAILEEGLAGAGKNRAGARRRTRRRKADGLAGGPHPDKQSAPARRKIIRDPPA